MWEVEFWLDHEVDGERRFAVKFDDQSEALRFIAWVVEVDCATFAILRSLVST